MNAPRATCASSALRLLACLLALLVLLATGCAPRMKADVQAVSAPGFRKAGQSYVLAPGPALTTFTTLNADMFRQSTQRLRAVLTGHGYREAASAQEADLAVVVEWKVDGPHEVPDTSSYGYSRPSIGIGIGYGSSPWYGGGYGDRYGRWGYGGYRGIGGGYGYGYGYPPPMTVVHTRTLSIEARDLRPGRAAADAAEPKPQDMGKAIPTAVADARPAAPGTPGTPQRDTPPPAPPAGQALTGQTSTGQPAGGSSPGAPRQPAATPSGEVPDYAKPPYGTPIGVVEGLPSPAELTGPVVWKVVVSSTGSSRDIQSALPALTVAASRWIGVTANVKVTVDDELNVTIQGQ